MAKIVSVLLFMVPPLLGPALSAWEILHKYLLNERKKDYFFTPVTCYLHASSSLPLYAAFCHPFAFLRFQSF